MGFGRSRTPESYIFYICLFAVTVVVDEVIFEDEVVFWSFTRFSTITRYFDAPLNIFDYGTTITCCFLAENEL